MALNLGELYGTMGLDSAPVMVGVDKAVDYLKSFGTRGAVVAGTAGLAIAGALGVSIFQGMNIEAANDKLAAQLGLSEAESKRVGGVAGALYADAYGESMEQVNQAVGSVMQNIEGMSTASSAELEDVTASVLDVATAFDEDLGGVTRAVGDLMRNGLAGDATEALDLITAGFQGGLNKGEDFLDTINEYAPDFRELGLSGADAFGIIQQGLEGGARNADLVADAMREFGDVVKDDAAGAGEAFSSLGLNADDMLATFAKGGPGAKAALGEVIAAINSVEDPIARQEAGVALFGTKFLDLGPQVFESLAPAVAGLDGVGGAVDQLGATLNGNASTSLVELKRKAELTFARLGNWALPIVNNLAAAAADNFGPALSNVAMVLGFLLGAVMATFGFIEQHQTIFGVIATIILTLLIPAFVAMGIQATLAATRTVLAWLSTSAGAVMSAVLQVASLTLIGLSWIRVGAQAMAGAVRTAAAWLIAMGPIGLVIAAVVGVVVAIVKNWDTIRAKTAAAWDWVVNKVKAVPGLLVGFFMNFTLPGLIIKHFDSIRSGVKNKLDSVVGFLRSLPGRLLSAVGDLGSLLWGVGGDIIAGLGRGIEAGLGWIRGKLSGIGRMIPGWLKSVLGINSPSTVMRDEVGQWIPAGVADGIVAGTPMVEAAAERMAALMVKAPKRGMAPTDMFGGPGGPVASGAGYGGPLVQMDVHPTPGMDEQTVGRSAGDQLQFRLEQMGVS